MNPSRPTPPRRVVIVDHATLLGLLAKPYPPQLVHGGGPAVFRRCHIPGSAAFDGIEAAVRGLVPDDLVVVYGTDRNDRASNGLAHDLAQQGFACVALYADGIAGWVRAGGAVEGTEAPS